MIKEYFIRIMLLIMILLSFACVKTCVDIAQIEIPIEEEQP